MDVHVLHLIKKAQKEHGVTTQNNYTRYRRYCTAQLRHLYKKSRRGRGQSGCAHEQSISHAKRRKMKNVALVQPFKQNVVNVDINYLLILLFSAERAWSHAMAIKQAAHSHQRSHLITRLAKAVKWADLFSDTCAQSTNPRTSLEATAYAAYMKFSYLIERGQHWDVARENLHNAKLIYEAFASVESADQEIFRRIVEDEIGPSTYKMGMNRSTSVPDEGPCVAAAVSDMLTAKLEVVMGSSQQAIKTAGFLNWLDHKFAMDNARTRSCISKGQRLEAKLDISKSSERELAVTRKILGAYQDARRHIREDLIAGGTDCTERDGLLGLDRAVSCMILQQTLNHKEILVSMSKSRLRKHPSKQGKNVQEQQLAGLYDSLLETLTDLYDLVTSARDPSSGEVAFASQLASKKLAFQAQRCFYLAQAQSQYARAQLLYQRAHEYTDAALSNTQQQLPEDQHMRGIMKELEELSKECRRQCCLVHALGTSEALRAEKLLQNKFAEMSLNSMKKPEKTVYLSERADNLYVPAVLAHDGELPHILQLPPVLQAVPCKPFFLDTAANAIRFPSLEKYTRKEDGTKSFFGRFWRS